MKLTPKEWLDMQKKAIRVCEGPESVIPKAIFIGSLKEDGIIEVRMKMVTAAEWQKFQEVWEKVSGADSSKEQLPRKVPQFFLI
ncbi:MAG: hypothetical protein Q4E86_07620 [Lachnospiraceae bacterium]|nr:hypothetical protein [Lachnospiraceae bacterium]